MREVACSSNETTAGTRRFERASGHDTAARRDGGRSGARPVPGRSSNEITTGTRRFEHAFGGRTAQATALRRAAAHPWRVGTPGLGRPQEHAVAARNQVDTLDRASLPHAAAPSERSPCLMGNQERPTSNIGLRSLQNCLRSLFGVRCSAFGVQRSKFEVRRSTLVLLAAPPPSASRTDGVTHACVARIRP